MHPHRSQANWTEPASGGQNLRLVRPIQAPRASAVQWIVADPPLGGGRMREEYQRARARGAARGAARGR
jgi:hypothetical protein